MSSATRRFRLLHGLGLLAFLVVAASESESSPAKLHWPDPQLNFIEEVLYGASGLAAITQNCARRENTTVAAQWVRIAYHDMATHNASDGSGGLDASIVYELDRPQNVGVGMKQSLLDFAPFSTPYVSLADTIAMGVVLGVASCDGPAIPFRPGRINAKKAGPATVPEPHQDLQTHIASFKRQGFDQKEMITLVACGHTLGGVRHDDFPTIVEESVDVADFDSTVAAFDTAIVTQYLDGSSVDPPNIAIRSDLRIFSSDGNATMQSLSTKAAFDSDCKRLLERMIDAVPKQVKLGKVIEPIESKVVEFFFYTKNGSYTMDVALRRPTKDSPSPETVTLYWLPRNKPKSHSHCPSSGCSIKSTLSQISSASFLAKKEGISGYTKHYFTVQAPLDVSIAKFWFVIEEKEKEKDGSEKTVVDNWGDGYVIDQDVLLYDPVRTQHDPDFNFNIVIAVRNDGTSSSKLPDLSIRSWEPGTLPTFTSAVNTRELQLDRKHPPADGYSFFTADIPQCVTAILVEASIDGKQFKLYREKDDFIVAA